MNKMIDLFIKYRESFGLDDQEDLEKQCKFEDLFAALICEDNGHNMVPDMCGKPEHDICTVCYGTREHLTLIEGKL